MASTNGPAGLNLIGRRAQVREAKQEADRKKAEAEAVEKDANELDAFSKKGKTAAEAYGKARDDAKRSIDDIKKQLDESRKAIQDAVDCDAKARVDARLEALTAHLARLKKAIDDLDGMPEPPCGPSVVALTIARDHARLQVTRAEFELTTLLELPQELPKKVAQLTKLATQLTGDLCTRAQHAESNYRLFGVLDRARDQVADGLLEQNDYAHRIDTKVAEVARLRDSRRAAEDLLSAASDRLKNAKEDQRSTLNDPVAWVEAAQTPGAPETANMSAGG